MRAGFFGCWGESAEAAQLGDVGVERGHGLGGSVGGAGGVWLIRASGGGCGGEAADVEERDRVPEGSVGGVGGVVGSLGLGSDPGACGIALPVTICALMVLLSKVACCAIVLPPIIDMPANSAVSTTHTSTSRSP